MTREEIITGLQERGYDVEAHDVVKNGVVFKGIMFRPESETKFNVAPIIYTSDIIKVAEMLGIGLSAVISKIEDEYKNSKDLNINFNYLRDRNYILNNIYIAIQCESDDVSLVKRGCMLHGIESFLYIRFEEHKGGYCSSKVNNAFLELAGIEINEAWKYAERNTNNESVLITMQEALEETIKEILGEDAVMEEDATAIPFYVLTNKYRTNGASAILNKKLLMEFAKKFNTDKIVVLPSSIHETLIMPFEVDLSIEDFARMVQEINDTAVNPEERLSDMAYVVIPFENRAYGVEPY